MTTRYRMTAAGAEAVAEDGTATLLTAGSDEYATFFQWLVAGGIPENAINAETLPAMKARLSDAIDTKVAAVYDNWMRFAEEYRKREAAAQAFKDAGYAGDPGVWVTAFATAAGKTNQQAADLILAQSVMLNGALATLGALRMRKYEVIGAADAAAAQAAYDDILAKIEQTAAQIQ